MEEAKERKIMKLLLKVKNGTPPQRKAALRQLTDKARELGAGPLFNQILPLLVRGGGDCGVGVRRNLGGGRIAPLCSSTVLPLAWLVFVSVG